MDEITLQPEAYKPQYMTKLEGNIVIETLIQFKDSIIDYLRLIETLRDCKDIDDEAYQRTVWKYRREPPEKKDNQLSLIFSAFNKMSFDKIVSVLKQAGCDDFVFVLVQKKFKGIIHHVRKRSISNVCLIFSYYKTQKAHIDNHIMGNRKETLRTQIDQLKEDIHNEDLDMDKRQESADRAVPLFVLLMLQHRGRDARQDILREMTSSIPNELDKTLADSVYHSKKAVTEAIAGNHSEAVDHANEAERICSLSETCFASVLAAHDHQYVFRQNYMRTYRLDDLKEILKLGDMAIREVSSEERDVQDQWKRLVLSYKALSLLNITSMFDVRETAPHSDKYMDKLDSILRYFRKISDTAEDRRLMSYNVCMARYKHLQKDLNAAYSYQEEAVRLAEKGGVFFEEEKHNIIKYRNKLKQLYAASRREAGEFGETRPS